MREIKFRAWHSITRQMLPDAQVGVIRTITKDGSYLVAECEYMQYTGLHDKTGKEIYEWDFVEMDYGGVFEIVYYRNGFYINDGLQSQFDEEKVKIIGNHFEHPDLLPS